MMTTKVSNYVDIFVCYELTDFKLLILVNNQQRDTKL